MPRDAGACVGSCDSGQPAVELGLPPTKVRPGLFDGCRGWEACPPKTVCNLALGRCEDRVDWAAPAPALLSFHPPAAAPGDLLVIDGARLWSNPLLVNPVEVHIGGQPQATLEQLDDTRVLVRVAAMASGKVELIGGAGVLAAAAPLAASSPGELACDGSTPDAPGIGGPSPRHAGPHGAGYLDLPAKTDARLFYPARCGGVRRPAAAGTWPMVVLMHGNGAGYLQYEYLGQLLASWGLIALLPDARVDYEADDIVAISPAQTATLRAAIAAVHEQDLSSVAPQLASLGTSGKVAWIGHSRGAARIQAVLAADPTLRGASVATIFLGPVDDGATVPGLFLLLEGTADAQSLGLMTEPIWQRQPAPKWRVVIKGGNHSLFTDHKVWTGFLDHQPGVFRAQQLSIVTTFVLPLLQRAFALDEPFAKTLDAPAPSPVYTLTAQ